MTCAFVLTAIFSWISCWTDNPTMSTFACIGNSATIACMNLYRWPHADEVVVVPQFFWSLLIISGNFDLSFAYKSGMGMIALFTTLIVAIFDPILEVNTTLPLLLGATAVHIIFNYYTTQVDKTKGVINAHGASMILAGTFAYHMSSELIDMISSPGYAREGGYSILKAAFFALVGLAAAGAFRQEIDMKETLEILVEARAKEIMLQADRLRVVEHALQASETAIAITDSEQKVMWSNSALERLTHIDAKAIQSTLLLHALGITTNGVQEATHEWFSKDTTTQNEVVVHSMNLHIEISPFPSEGRDGRDSNDTSRFLVVLKDITGERARERAEKAAVREALAAQAMQESMQTLSHELRTPLQGIMGMTSLMLDDDKMPNNVIECMTVVMTSARLLLTLINNMLDLRKCETSMMDEFQLTPMNLSQALTTAVDFCRPFAGITEAKLCFPTSGLSQLTVKSNGLRFQQVMINLISNAIKYTSAGSSVSMNVQVMTVEEANALAWKALIAGTSEEDESADGPVPSADSKVAVVSVSDIGPGIPEEQKSHIFGKFSQLDTTPTNSIGGGSVGQPAGTGLGLHLCLQFVHRMHGKIWANNNAGGQGSTFSFCLPMVADRDIVVVNTTPETSESMRASPTSVVYASYIDRCNVLVVDDSIINLKVLDRILKRVGVGKVTVASSAKAALEAIEKDTFNLVLTDLQMPEMSGVELTTIILGPGRGEATKPLVVGLTAQVSESVDARCRSVGMIDVLHKPITAAQMHHFFESMGTRFATQLATQNGRLAALKL